MKVLVVDDSTLYRKVVRDALEGLPGLECVGVARDGVEALDKVRSLRPDLVTLDQEMPRLDGLGVLRALREESHPPRVVMISSPTLHSAGLTAEALRLGALDFVVKPEGTSFEDAQRQLRNGLQQAVQAAAACVTERPTEQGATARPPFSAEVRRPVARPAGTLGPRLTLIGVSTGGPAALGELLPRLPADFPTPVIVVQHMPPLFTRSLAEQLDRQCALRVCEASDGEPCRPGCVYVAPGGKQLRVVAAGDQLALQTSDDAPEKSCKPSVDYLFRSAAEAVGGRAVAVILTGMGDDGTEGCAALKRRGAAILAQDEASCVVYGMPRRVAEAGLADVVAPLGQLADLLQSAAIGDLR